MRLTLVTLFSLVWLFLSVASAADMTIVYSGNLDGELEPCGCSAEGDLGGIKRRVTAIDRLRESAPELFLLSSGGLIVSYTAHDRLTSEYILKGYAALDYDAIGVQWPDLSYGVEFIGARQLPWVSSNWRAEKAFSPVKTIRRGNRKLAFFSWLDPDAEPQMADSQMHMQQRADHNPDDLVRSLAKARSGGAVTVLATTLDYPVIRKRVTLKDVDVLIVESAYEEYGEPAFQNGTLVLQPGSRGMRLGRLDLKLDEQSRIKSFKHQVISMPSSVPDSPRMAAWYQEYNTRVKEAYLESVKIRKAIESGTLKYAGAQACQACHNVQYAKWLKTQHAIAFDDLALVNKAFDPGCIGCHTVGFDEEGGYIDNDVTAHLTGVQCESCHGAAQSHVASGGQQPVANSTWSSLDMCQQCHVQKHSPGFDFDTYWPRIAHPGTAP